MLKLDATSIPDCILNILETLRLDYNSSLIGLGFDGVSAIRVQLSGVQKRTRNKEPIAYYVYCYGHRLNLVLFNATKHVPGAANFFSLLENLYIFVSNPVVHEKFLAIREMFFSEQVR